MKTFIKNQFLLPTLIVSLNLMLAGRVTAQTFTNLHSFGSTPTDGLQPTSGLVLSGNLLYGTTDGGGSSGSGAIFSIHTDGTGYTNLYSFTAGKTNSSGILTNSDGANPGGGYVPGGRLVLSGNILYGTTFNGGSGGYGTVFKVHTDGTSFTNLHSFLPDFNGGNDDGANPDDNLILSGDTLYGATLFGGIFTDGTIYKVNTDGTSFTTLHNFPFIQISNTNSDGALPLGGLVLLGDMIYGTTDTGGPGAGGTIFAVNTTGTVFTNLHSFDASLLGANSDDGDESDGGLVLSGVTLYGTTSRGGANNGGTVFKISADGTGYTIVHSFDGLASVGTNNVPGPNTGGSVPFTSLTIAGSTLYGAAQFGGSFGNGTLFALNTDGTGFTTLYNFTAISTNSFGYFTNSDGAFPYGSLTISSNVLYGTTTTGGIYGTAYQGEYGPGGGFLAPGDGTLFSLKLPPPQLTIIPSGTNVILTWPANTAEYILQSTTNLVSSAVWGNVSPSAVIVNGQNTVTNPISGTQQFFRLSQ